MIVVLWFLSNVTTETTITTIIVLHSLLMVGVSLVMMPAQTNGLNQLPKDLYPDGTALMNTLQQVSGAIGTTVAITIMSASQKSYMLEVENPLDPTVIGAALTAGVQDAFIFGLLLAVVGLVVSLFIKNAREKA